jgi:hypothetical protein
MNPNSEVSPFFGQSGAPRHQGDRQLKEGKTPGRGDTKSEQNGGDRPSRGVERLMTHPQVGTGEKYRVQREYRARYVVRPTSLSWYTGRIRRRENAPPRPQAINAIVTAKANPAVTVIVHAGHLRILRDSRLMKRLGRGRG